MMYKCGDKFLIDDKIYILGNIDATQAVLISLSDGNRWREPNPVENVSSISEHEMKIICGDSNFADVVKLSHNEFIEHLTKLATPVYKFGQRFIADGQEFMLVRVGSTLAALVSLFDGNRWRDAVEIDSNSVVDEKNFLKIVGEGNEEYFKLMK